MITKVIRTLKFAVFDLKEQYKNFQIQQRVASKDIAFQQVDIIKFF